MYFVVQLTQRCANPTIKYPGNPEVCGQCGCRIVENVEMYVNKLQKHPWRTLVCLHDPCHNAYDDSAAVLQFNRQLSWIFVNLCVLLVRGRNNLYSWQSQSIAITSL